MVSYSFARPGAFEATGAFGVGTVKMSLRSPSRARSAGCRTRARGTRCPRARGAASLARAGPSTNASLLFRHSGPPPLLAALLAGLVRRGVGLAAGRGHRVHHVHGCGDAVVDHAANGGHGAVDDLGQLGPLDRVEAGEDPVGSPAPKAGRGLADADPDANELGGSEALNHAPHAVIAGMPAADLDAHLAPRQVELVVNDDHSRRWHLEEGHRRLNAVARE